MRCGGKIENVYSTARREPMSLQPQAIPPVPGETARIAHAILPKGNTSIHLRDELGTFFRDEDFLDVLRGTRTTSRISLASGPGDGDALCGRVNGETGSRCRQDAH